MKKWMLACALLVAPGVANAAPVYLECMLPKAGQGSEELLWNITLNETEGTVHYTIPETGVAAIRPAVFSAEEVRFANLTINRVDLTFTRRTQVGAGAVAATGKCRLAPIKERAF